MALLQQFIRATLHPPAAETQGCFERRERFAHDPGATLGERDQILTQPQRAIGERILPSIANVVHQRVAEPLRASGSSGEHIQYLQKSRPADDQEEARQRPRHRADRC
jgi:hypothetical protein